MFSKFAFVLVLLGSAKALDRSKINAAMMRTGLDEAKTLTVDFEGR